MSHPQHHGGRTHRGRPSFGQKLTTILEETNSIVRQFSDVPPSRAELSPRLKYTLANAGLEELELLLQRRGVRTLRALSLLESTERKTLLCVARQIFELLGVFPIHLQQNLNDLLGVSWQDHTDVQPIYTPVTLPDDTASRRRLHGYLLAASPHFGPARYEDCLRSLKRADEHAVAACSETAEALAALCLPREFVPIGPEKKIYKDAKGIVRDVLFWRAAAVCPGIDSREALRRAWNTACSQTRYLCDENTDSQMQNALKRILEELAGGPAPKRRSGQSPARIPERRAGAGQQQTGGSSSSTLQPERLSEDRANAPRNVSSDLNRPNFMDRTLNPEDQEPIKVNSSWRPPGLERCFDSQEQEPRQHRSPSPSFDRAPGGSSSDGGQSQNLQMTQMLEMMKVMKDEIRYVKASVLRRNGHPFLSTKSLFESVYESDESGEDSSVN